MASSSIPTLAHCYKQTKSETAEMTKSTEIQVKGEQLTDAELMERLVRREEPALEQLYRRYSRTVYSLVVRITGQPAASQEIVQEVFLELWRNAHAYRPSRGPVEPWLLTLSRYRALDYIRGRTERQRQREESAENFSLVSAMPDPEQWVDQQRRAELVRELINSLPNAQRQAIELAYFEGMTHSEIAAAMKQPLGTVKTWIRSALFQLRQKMAEGR